MNVVLLYKNFAENFVTVAKTPNISFRYLLYRKVVLLY